MAVTVGFMPGTDDDTLELRAYADFAGLEWLREAWDALAAETDCGVALTYDWCRIWWRHYGDGRRLCILTVRRQGRLAAVLPLFFETLGIWPLKLRVGKLLGSDHTLASMTLPMAEADYPVLLPACLAWLGTHRVWDMLYFGPLSGLHARAEALAASAAGEWRCRLVVCGPQTFFRLADSWEAQLADMPRHERANIRRDYHHIAHAGAGGLRVEVADAGNLDALFDEFVALHQAHWQAVGKRGHFGDWPRAVDYHRDMARAQLERGRLRLMRVSLDDSRLGFQYHYLFGGQMLHFLDARTEEDVDRFSHGRVCFCEAMKNAIAEGVRWADSLQGRYEYKLRLGGELRDMRGVFITRPSVRWRLPGVRLVAVLLHKVYYYRWFLRLSSHLPAAWRRPLWRRWIRSHFLFLAGS